MVTLPLVCLWSCAVAVAAHTHAHIDHHVYHCLVVCMGWTIPLLIFLIAVQLTNPRTWCNTYHLWYLFGAFPHVSPSHTHTQMQSHQIRGTPPMIFKSGTQEKT